MFNTTESQLLSNSFSKSLRGLSPESTLQSLVKQMDDYQIELSRSGQELYDIFEKNTLLPGAILNQKNKFIGMVSRRQFWERISTQYGRDTFLRRNLECLYSFINHEILILPANTPIFETVRQCLQRAPQILYEPLIVKFHNETYKLLDTQKLLIAQTKIYEQCLKTLGEHQIQLNRAYIEITQKQEREAQLKRQLEELQIEIDQQKRKKEVAEITQSDYFQELKAQAELLQFDESW